ncbi:hypothetical protein ACFFMP_03000 [Pseudoroseomonas cervicalis]|uniref:Uncharacterized protein n=1 Tax=Pseudoroseomonas cervicalis ATCC 49957 TaxID=525371 RepID=D5RP84_9PROT|nr:hypothetical protein [Pseudoroseomonas cervicalis]EFH10881.1 hypothetical protein HMPREF0731_2895 [Pseudoroseomonas cervicalis ATCC 49957]
MAERYAANSDLLRQDINRGSTGDKVNFTDPAAAPLGADDEAAGTPPSAEAVRLARQLENTTSGEAMGLARGGSVKNSIGPSGRSRVGLGLLIAGAVMIALVAAALMIG